YRYRAGHWRIGTRRRGALLPVDPVGGFEHRFLVKLEAELHKRPLGGIGSSGKILVREADHIVTDTYPGILHDVVSQRRPCAVTELVGIPGVKNAPPEPHIPRFSQVVS